MPPLELLSQRDALELAKQATSDFPGLLVLLEPVIAPRPLTEHLYIAGWVLLVCGARGRSPWFELRSALAYDDLYEQIYAHYDVLEPCAPDDDDDDAPAAPLPNDVLPLWGDGQSIIGSASNSPPQYTPINKDA